MPFWNPEISLGNVIGIIGIVVGLWASHVSNVRRIERISTKLDILYDWFLTKQKDTHA